MYNIAVNKALRELRERIAKGDLSEQELRDLIHELDNMVQQVTQTLTTLTTQIERIKRSQQQIRDYR